RSTLVTVGSVVPPRLGSSVTMGLPTNAPLRVPWAVTFGLTGPLRAGGVFSVALKVIVVVLPAGSVNPPAPVPEIGNVPGGGDMGIGAEVALALPVTTLSLVA